MDLKTIILLSTICCFQKSNSCKPSLIKTISKNIKNGAKIIPKQASRILKPNLKKIFISAPKITKQKMGIFKEKLPGNKIFSAIHEKTLRPAYKFMDEEVEKIYSLYETKIKPTTYVGKAAFTITIGGTVFIGGTFLGK